MKQLYFLLTFLLFSNVCLSQIKAITEIGDTIMVYDNGTWKKVEQMVDLSEIQTTVKTTVTVDEFDNSKFIRTESWFGFGKNNLGNIIEANLVKADGDLIACAITYYGDLGCFSQNRSTMKVKLSNGEVVDFVHIGDTDCSSTIPKGLFIPSIEEDLLNDERILMENVRRNIELLKKNDWVTIRLHGSKYYTDISPNPNKKRMPKPEQFFRQHILAIEKEN